MDPILALISELYTTVQRQAQKLEEQTAELEALKAAKPE